jgi:hypothetical protein
MGCLDAYSQSELIAIVWLVFDVPCAVCTATVQPVPWQSTVSGAMTSICVSLIVVTLAASTWMPPMTTACTREG